MRNGYINRLTIFVAAALIAACVSIPPEAPELSIALGHRISALEDANVTLLYRFFDQKRNDIDEFIAKEWVPIFAQEVFSNKIVSKAWDTIVKENNESDRLKFIVTLGPRLQKKINAKRLELIKPLDELEAGVEQRIRGEYNQARALNNSITSFLFSASEVVENRNRYLELIGVTDEKIGRFIDKTDDAVTGLLKGTKEAEKKAQNVEEYLEKLRSILDSL